MPDEARVYARSLLIRLSNSDARKKKRYNWLIIWNKLKMRRW
jgi:hypothetical protein